jgi:hypothetical protein
MKRKKKSKVPMTSRVTVRMTEPSHALVLDAAEIAAAKAGSNPSTAIRQALMRWAKGTIGAHEGS